MAICEVHLNGRVQYLVNPKFLCSVIKKGPYRLLFYLLAIANIQENEEVIFLQSDTIEWLKIDRITFFRWCSFLKKEGWFEKIQKTNKVRGPKWLSMIRKVVLNMKEDVVIKLETENRKYYFINPEFLWQRVIKGNPYKLFFYFLDLQNKKGKNELILYQDDALEKFRISLPTFYRWVQFLRDNNLVRQLNKFTYLLNLPYLPFCEFCMDPQKRSNR